MIKIEIEISDTPLGGDQFYGRIQATHEGVGIVSDHERQMRDWIMNLLEAGAKRFVQSEGITKAIVAKIPLKEIRRKQHGDGDLSNPG